MKTHRKAMQEDILLPLGKSKTVTIKLAWSQAVAEAVYPLHQKLFPSPKRKTGVSYAQARRQHSQRLERETVARLLEHIHDKAAGSLTHLAALAEQSSQTARLDVTSVRLKPDSSAVDQAILHFAHRPKGHKLDHRMAFVAS